MAPNFTASSTRSGRWPSITSTTSTASSYSYYTETYDDYYVTSTTASSDNYSYYITTVEQEKKIKKLLKRMTDDMCKIGWINYIPYYSEPKLKPVSLRGVRYDGRGWAGANS